MEGATFRVTKGDKETIIKIVRRGDGFREKYVSGYRDETIGGKRYTDEDSIITWLKKDFDTVEDISEDDDDFNESTKGKYIFAKYMEMAVSFEKGEKLHSFDDFKAALKKSKVRPSDDCEFDSQSIAWITFAKNNGFKDIQSLATAVANYDGLEPFPGIEGLAVMSSNARLFDLSDYGRVDENGWMCEWFDTGSQTAINNWISAIKGKVTAGDFILSFLKYMRSQYDLNVNGVGKTTFAIDFNTEDQSGTKENILGIFNSLDELFDFDIKEPKNADQWTITVKAK